MGLAARTLVRGADLPDLHEAGKAETISMAMNFGRAGSVCCTGLEGPFATIG